MKMNIFGREADFDQLAIATRFPSTLMKWIGGSTWSHDHAYSRAVVAGYPEPKEVEFKLFYNYEQDIPFKELELIQFLSLHNFHSVSNRGISPLGLYAPSLYEKLGSMGVDMPFISHLGIHCTEEEGKDWRFHLGQRDIHPVWEDTSYKHTNPIIAGKRTYHNIIFGSREALGFDFKACIRINANESA